MKEKTLEEIEAGKKPATLEAVDSMKKSIADLVELAKKRDTEYADTIKSTVKEVLAAHPGFTPDRKIEFPEQNLAITPQQKAERVVRRMPIELKKQLNEVFLLSKCMNKPVQSLKAWDDFKSEAKDYKKALDATTAGGVDEWVPTTMTSEFFEFVRLETLVAKLFRTIPMPTNPYEAPIGVGRLMTFLHSEQTGDTGQTKVPVGDTSNLSNKLTLTAVGHGTRVLVSKDAEEDAIVPLLSWLQAEIIIAMAEGREVAILNGDTAGSHEDTDVSSADDRRKLWLGLRALSNDNTYLTDLGTYNATNIIGMRKQMGRYGVRPGNLAFVTGISGFLRMLDFAEVITVDKYGAGATILTGELAKLGGIPVIVSEHVREDLNASAVYASGGTKTVLHLVNRDGFIIGERRTIKTQLLKELYAESDQDALVVRERVIFDDIYPIASNKTVWTGRNVAI